MRKLSGDLLARDARSVAGLRLRGELALLDRSPVDALPLFRQAHEIDPADRDVVHGLMQAMLGVRQYAEAEKVARDFLARDKTFGLVYDDLYSVYGAAGRPKDAEQVFRDKVANNPAEVIYRLQLAAHYTNTNQPREMENSLQPLLTDAKTFPEGRLEAGQFYARLGMWEQARAVHEETVRTSPQLKLKAQKLLIQAALARNQTAEAEKIADATAAEFRDDDEARFLRASLWVDSREKDKIKAAIAELNQLRDQRGKLPTYWYVLGQAHQRSGDDRAAETAFRESVKLDRSFKDGWIALTELNLSRGQAKPALEAIQQATVFHGDDPRVQLLLGRALLESGQATQARAGLATLAAAQPRSVPVQLQYGRALLATGQYDQAEAIFKRFYRPGQKDLAALDGLVRVLGARGQGRAAFALAESEWKRDPQSKPLSQLMAQVAIAEQRPELAVDIYRQLARSEPDTGIHHYQLAQALRLTGDRDNAIASLETVEKLEPDNPVPLSVLAFLLQEAGRNEEAGKRWRRLLQLRPDDANVQNNLAYVLAESGGSLDEAMALAQKALRSSPANPSYMDTLGWIYLKQKKPAAATQTFRAAVNRSPGQSTYLFHLGLSLLEEGKKSEASAVFNDALKSKPDKQEEARIREALQRAS